MKLLLQRFHRLLTSLDTVLISKPKTACDSFDILEDKKLMLRELTFSKDHGNLVGVYARPLGEGMFLVGVEDIVSGDNDRECLIILFPLDMSGLELSRRVIELGEIAMIVPFNNPYRVPERTPVNPEPVLAH